MSVKDFIDQNSEYFALAESGKVRCLLTGHELKADRTELNRYVNGRRFTNIRDKYSKDFSQFSFVMPHKRAKHLVFCSLCRKEIVKDHASVTKHMTGRKHNARVRERDEAMEGNPKKRHRGNDEDGESGEGTADEIDPFFMEHDSDQDEDDDHEEDEEPENDDDDDDDDDDEDDDEEEDDE